MIRETEAILALVREQANALAQVDKRLTWIDKRNRQIRLLIKQQYEDERSRNHHAADVVSIACAEQVGNSRAGRSDWHLCGVMTNT